MTDLNALIDRVEKATGPDRELEKAVIKALGFDAWAGVMSYPTGDGRWFRFGSSNITESIDAALALVERVLGKHWNYQIKNAIGVQVILWMLETDYDDRSPPTGTHMDSVPLAIILATLRALKAKQATDA